MRRTLAALVLLVALPVAGQGIDFRTSTSTSTQIWTFRPSASVPPVAATGAGKMYLDSSCGCIKWSYSGSAWDTFGPSVTSFNARTGAIVPTLGDYSVAQVTGAAPLASPTFTGVPAAPTAAADTNTTQVATTAFVVGQSYLKSATAATTYAPLASPALTGTPTAPTPLTADDSTAVATTAFVKAQTYETVANVALKAPIASPTFTGVVTVPSLTLGATAITASGTEINRLVGVTSGVQTQLDAKAPIAAPSFTTSIQSPIVYVGGTDVVLARDAANVLAQRNGVNAQFFRLYREYTDASNYGRLSISASSASILFEAAGTGGSTTLSIGTSTANSLFFITGGSARWSVSGGGVFAPQVTNTYDIGSSSTRVRTGYFGTSVQIGTAADSTLPLYVSAAAVGAITSRLENTDSAGSFQLQIRTGDGTTSSRNARLRVTSFETSSQQWDAGMNGSKPFVVRDVTNSRTPLSISESDGLVTFANGLDASGGDLRTRAQRVQSFILEIVNTAGTIQHRIAADSLNFAASSYVAAITGASTTLANTPTVNSTTPFVSGAGIFASDPRYLILDSVNAQATADGNGIAYVEYNDTGTAITVAYRPTTQNVNGTSIMRPAVAFSNATTGATFQINTTNIPAGKKIHVRFFGFIK